MNDNGVLSNMVDSVVLIVGVIVGLFFLVLSWFLFNAFFGWWFRRKKQGDKSNFVIPEEPKKEENVVKSFDPVRSRKSWFSYNKWRDFFIVLFHKPSLVMANIELLNGRHRTLMVKGNANSFKFQGKEYVFDDEAKYYVSDCNLWAFDYHESFSLPIKRRIEVNDVVNAMDSLDDVVVNSTNPSTLRRFVISEVAKGVMQGAQIHDKIRMIVVLIVIGIVVGVIHLLLYAQKIGVFAQLGV